MEELHAETSQIVEDYQEEREEFEHDGDDDGCLAHEATGFRVDGVPGGDRWLRVASEEFDEGGDSEDSEHFANDVAVVGDLVVGKYFYH